MVHRNGTIVSKQQTIRLPLPAVITVIYTNLLIFIAAIFMFSLASSGETPAISFGGSLAIYAASLVVFWLLVKRVFANPRTKETEGYFAAEKKLSILALLFFTIILFSSDIKYYLGFLSLNQRFPVLTNIGGLLLFFSYLALIWSGAHRSYASVFGKLHSPASFVSNNFRFNLTIVLPWIALTLMYDLLALIPSSHLGRFLDSLWGDLFFLGLFLIMVLLFFPPLVRRLWNCTEMPEGVL